jgi:ABC-type antimicrobial peptide transport system permease subunit
VGVVENVYDDGVDVKPPEFVYWPALMDRYIWAGENGFAQSSGMFAIRSIRTGTDDLLAEAQQAIWSVNGRQPVFLVTTLKTLYDQSMVRTSFTLVMLAIAGAMALTLGLIGIYGVIAYAVTQRRREIGIRLALGAQQRELKLMFVRDGLRLSGIGLVIGLAAAAGLTRLMTSLLFEVTPLDPFAYAAAPIVLVTAAMLASYLPARRAARVNPVETLKGE